MHRHTVMQIHKSTVYEGGSISSQPKVEADVLYSCNLATTFRVNWFEKLPKTLQIEK